MGEAELQLEAIRAAWSKVASEYPSVRGAGIWKPLREAICGPDPEPDLRWSYSRAQALGILRNRITCRRSNGNDDAQGCILAQAADWLVVHGFAELVDPDHVRITAPGQSVRVDVRAKRSR